MNSNIISISSLKDKIKVSSNENLLNPNKIINMQSPNTNNSTDIQNQTDNNIKNNLSIYNYINEMPFENLNDYYDIESSLFLKRIEKLNIKFYWTSECVLNQQDIKYPYNKLFLILFKQISLYIEEIARLNKQLKQKIKIEKGYQLKLAKMKQKENENTLNKQMLKNLQRDNKLLEKSNEKIKNENEKLNKKLMNLLTDNSTNLSNLNKNNNKGKNYICVTPRFSDISMGYNKIFSPETFLAKKVNRKSDLSGEKNKKLLLNNSEKNRNRNKSVCSSIEKTYIIAHSKEIINNGINLCNEEIKNLEIMEEILENIKNKNINNINKKQKKINSESTNYKMGSCIKINNSNNYIKNNVKKDKHPNYNSRIQGKKVFH